MRQEPILSAMRYHLSSFLCDCLAEIAVQSPKLAPRIMKFHTRFDDTIAAKGIGYIGLHGEGTAIPALEILESRRDDYATDTIGKVAMKSNIAAYQAINILTDRDTRASTENIASIATHMKEMAPLGVQVLNKRDGDFVTRLIGNIGLHVDEAQRSVIDVLKTRKDGTSSHEMTEIAVSYPQYAAEVFEEIKNRQDQASIFCIGHLGQEIPGMGLRAIAYLKDFDNTYARDEIVEIGRKAGDSTAEAINIMLERKYYGHARSLAQTAHSLTPAMVLSRALVARDHAVASSGADPAVIDREFTSPVIRKVMPYDAYFFAAKGDLAHVYDRAARIVSSAPRPVKDDAAPGVPHTMPTPRAA